MLYVNNPDNYAPMAVKLGFKSEQLRECRSESEQITRAWTTLLKPFAKNGGGGGSTIARGDEDNPRGGSTQTVSMSNFTRYNHRNNLFSIEVPRQWKGQDTSQNGITNLVWVDPTGNAFVHVNIGASSGSNFQRYGSSFVERVFGSLNGFSIGEPVSTGNNSYRITWSYIDTSGSTRTRLVGNSFFSREGSNISAFTSVVPENQFDDLRSGLDRILNSFVVR
jgi:hypothetical protein